MHRSAEISDCGLYRWWLRRTWSADGPEVCFVMLNPSTADALTDDPTIRRCINFAKSWGYGSLVVRNLFAYRATDPRELRNAEDPIGGHRGLAELVNAKHAEKLVAAWGQHGKLMDRGKQALEIFQQENVSVYCLGTTKDGHPRHPLYVPSSQSLELLET